MYCKMVGSLETDTYVFSRQVFLSYENQLENVFVYLGRRLSYHSCNPTLSKACMWWWLGSSLARFSRISPQQEWFENNSQEAKQTKNNICRQLLKQAEIIWRVGYGVIELIGVVASMSTELVKSIIYKVHPGFANVLS